MAVPPVAEGVTVTVTGKPSTTLLLMMKDTLRGPLSSSENGEPTNANTTSGGRERGGGGGERGEGRGGEGGGEGRGGERERERNVNLLQNNTECHIYDYIYSEASIYIIRTPILGLKNV